MTGGVIEASGWLGVCRDVTSGPTAPSVRAGSLGPPPIPSIGPPAAGEGSPPIWPTNQWWTSLLTRPAEPLWSFPVAVRFDDGSMSLSVSEPVASANAVVTPFVATLAVVIPPGQVRVADFGDFHVVAAVGPAGEGATRVTIAQGSPAVWVRPGTDEFVVDLPVPADVLAVGGAPLVEGASLTTDHLSVTLPDGRGWNVVAGTRVAWSRSGSRLRADLRGLGERPEFGLVARPADHGGRWDDLAYASGLDRVTDTRAEWQLSGDEALQRLTWKRRRGGAGLIATLPHQRLGGRVLGEPATGTFHTARGELRVALSDVVEWAAPVPNLVLAVPEVPLTPAERSTVGAELDRELAALGDGTGLAAGSYFGPKQLGRLATLVDVARRFGSSTTTDGLLDLLETAVVDWVTYGGDLDARWLAYDPVWGGMMANVPEFGHEDYNDHLFQFGYLIQAAATLAEARPGLIPRLRPVIDLLAADIGPGSCTAGFPLLRVVNPYEGHSYASGFAPFADGNNQESSSEAVHGWWSLTRWAVATGQTGLAQRAASLYATEAAAARMYWLGEGLARPAAYDHQVSGIVWGAKLDFATFFDARPASIVGIQLLPFTFGSLYRDDPRAAAARYAEGSAGGDGHWQDLLAMDLAVADPDRAGAIIAGLDEFEEGNSRAFAIVWIAAQRQRTGG